MPTQLNIHKSIAAREYQKEVPIKLSLPSDDVEVKLELAEATELMTLTTALTSALAAPSSRQTPEKVYGFRLQKNLQRLAMASALSEGRDIVGQNDVRLIEDLAKHINLDYFPL